MFNIIPPDVASRLKQANDHVAATSPIRKLKDALTNLVPGQQVLAEIQAALPNGTYRAVVAQREIVLALPHSAKPGDTLELEVVENDGQLALALSKGKESATETLTRESVATSLSKTGRLISDLLSPPGKEGQKPVSLTLNGNQPIFTEPPSRGSDFAPALQQSITQSGMFYESHQAAWAEGKLPTSALMGEPQGKFSSLETLQYAQEMPEGNPFTEALHRPVIPAPPEEPPLQNADAITEEKSAHVASKPQDNNVALDFSSPPRSNTPIPQSLAPIIQQQLEAFASQNYAWQGTAWPGQAMEWEIADEGGSGDRQQDEDSYRWQTRLKLQLPALGNVSATLRLRGDNQIDVQIQTANVDSEIQLSLGGPALNQQMEDAGLYLATFGVTRADAKNDVSLSEERDE